MGQRVDMDEVDYGRWLRADGREPEWTHDFATRVDMHSWTVDIYDASEVLFGRRLSSYSMQYYGRYGPDDYEYTYNFVDGGSERVTNADLAPFYYEDVFDAYVYDSEDIGRLSAFPCSLDLRAYDMALLDYGTLRMILETYVTENETELDDDYAGDYYLRPVYVLVKAMMAAQKGEHVLIVES